MCLRCNKGCIKKRQWCRNLYKKALAKRRHKLSQVEKLPLLATPFGHDLRVLAMTCGHFDRAQICTQVNANFWPFGHPTQVVQVGSTILFLCTGARTRLHWNGFFANLCWTCAICKSVWPPIASLRTQIRFPNLRWLASPLGQGLITLKETTQNKRLRDHVKVKSFVDANIPNLE